MKIRLIEPVEYDVRFVKLDLPVDYDEEDMPNDFPFRNDDRWSVIVDADSGKILDWPQGFAYRLEMKVNDGGTYALLDEDKEEIASKEEDYVPGWIPGEYGDYVDLDINKDGYIEHWKAYFEQSEIQESFDDRDDD